MIMTKKRRYILIITVIVFALLIIWGRLYLFSYEDCMFTVEESLCGGTCDFKSVITHNYCE